MQFIAQKSRQIRKTGSDIPVAIGKSAADLDESIF